MKFVQYSKLSFHKKFEFKIYELLKIIFSLPNFAFEIIKMTRTHTLQYTCNKEDLDLSEMLETMILLFFSIKLHCVHFCDIKS